MSVIFPSQPTTDKQLLLNIVAASWYNEALEVNPEMWNVICNFNNHQLRELFDDSMRDDFRYTSFVKKSIKLCYGGGFFGPSTEAMNAFITDLRHTMQRM